MPSASRSRRAVRSEISSSSATSAAVTCPRACSSRRIATRRSARTRPSSQTNRPQADRFMVSCCVQPPRHEEDEIVDWKLELVQVPVTDVDRAKAFYTEKAGFNADNDV